jgi:hypothetical protein
MKIYHLATLTRRSWNGKRLLCTKTTSAAFLGKKISAVAVDNLSYHEVGTV